MSDAPTVAVRGEAIREVEPELARFTVTVAARDKDRQTTLDRLAERVAALRVLLDRYADAIDRRETSGLYVRPETKRSGERISAYAGSVSTTVTVHDFTRLGELLLQVADQDQTTVSGPWWSLRLDSPAHREARHAAIADAVRRAREYAQALGADLVRLVELTDAGVGGGGPSPPRPMLLAAGAERAAGGPQLDLEPQLQVVQASVEARFAISEPTVLGDPG